MQARQVAYDFPRSDGSSMLEMSCQAGHVGDAAASAYSLILRRLLFIVLTSPSSAEQQPHDPRVWVLITSCSRVLVGATQRKRHPRLHGERPNRDSTVELLIGWYSMISMNAGTDEHPKTH
jgi:hypothetical protein